MANPTVYAGRERRRARPSPLIIGLAVAGAAAIAYASLCPIGMRPHLASADTERFCAYFGLGALVARACGRKTLTALATLVVLAVALEAAQRLAPGRHAHLSDAAVKALGGVFGVVAAQSVYPFRRLLRRLRAERRPATTELA